MAQSHFSPLDIVFAGTPAFAVPALTVLHAAGHRVRAVYTQPDRPAGRGRVLSAGPVKTHALEIGLAVEQPATLRSPEALERLRSYAPQLMVVVAYGLILPQSVLDVPQLGCLNIHASLLPRWRGAAPIAQWRDGRIAPQPQPDAGASYARKIERREAAIDWTRDAAALDRQVRAFNPRPVAETTWSGQQLRVWEAVPVPRTIDAAPGSVIETGARLVIAAGTGALQIERLQLAGRRAMSAAEFQHAHSLAGARLGA